MKKREVLILAKSFAAECIGFRVRVLSRVITSIFDRVLQPFGLKLAQGNILIMLVIHGPVSSSSIGRVLSMEKSTVSRNLKRMGKKGLVGIVNKSGTNKQVVMVTSKGRNLVATIHVAWKKAQKESSDLLGAEGVAAVYDLFERIRQNKIKD